MSKIPTEKYALTDGMSNLNRLRLAGDNYLLAIIWSLVYAIPCYFFTKSINLLPVEIVFVAALCVTLAKLGLVEKHKPIFVQGDSFHCKGRTFSIGDVVSARTMGRRSWYCFYRIEVCVKLGDPPVNSETERFVFVVVDLRLRRKTKTDFEAKFLEKIAPEKIRNGLGFRRKASLPTAEGKNFNS